MMRKTKGRQKKGGEEGEEGEEKAGRKGTRGGRGGGDKQGPCQLSLRITPAIGRKRMRIGQQTMTPMELHGFEPCSPDE